MIRKISSFQQMIQNQNVTHGWRDYDETSIDQANVDAIVRSRILGLFMLQNIIIKLKQDKENATEEHQMNNNKIIIIDYRVTPNKPKQIQLTVTPKRITKTK